MEDNNKTSNGKITIDYECEDDVLRVKSINLKQDYGIPHSKMKDITKELSHLIRTIKKDMEDDEDGAQYITLEITRTYGEDKE